MLIGDGESGGGGVGGPIREGGTGPLPGIFLGNNGRRKAAGLLKEKMSLTPIIHVNTEPLHEDAAHLILGAYRSRPPEGYKVGHPKRKKITVITSINTGWEFRLLPFDPKQNPPMDIDETYFGRGYSLLPVDGSAQGMINFELEVGPSSEIYLISYGNGVSSPDLTIIEWFG